MSDDIPVEMQVEIIKRLPVKSLLQFRSVSKAWKSLIDSPRFIADYRGQVQHLLVAYEDYAVDERKFVLFVDDDTFPQQHFFPTQTLYINTQLMYSKIIGSTHGLLCLYHCFNMGVGEPVGIAVIWNLSIQKSVDIVVPHVRCDTYETVLGFGVCRETNDPKICKITQIKQSFNIESISSVPWQVEVFTLSTGVWRSPRSNLPRKSIYFGSSKVVVDGFLYWLATDRILMDGVTRLCNLIVSIDMTSEEFREIKLPNGLAHHFDVSISKLRESLVVSGRLVDSLDVGETCVFNVWMMEDDVSKSFTKLYTFDFNKPDASIVGFRKSGEPIIEIIEDDYGRQLVAYEPYSRHADNLGIDGVEFPFYVFPFIETLFLLDQPNFRIIR